jgi:hypothetical protein
MLITGVCGMNGLSNVWQLIFIISNEKDTIQVFILKRAFPAIDQESMNQLLGSVIDEKVKKNLFYMKLFKTPGPNGYQSYFYQSQWNIIGFIVCKFIKEVVEDKTRVVGINHSYFVLILKMYKPKYLHQFWPIGLCNVNFKILTKLLVNHIKSLMQKIVNKY